MLYITDAIITKDQIIFEYSNDFNQGEITIENTPRIREVLFDLEKYMPIVITSTEVKIDTNIVKIRKKQNYYIVNFCTEVPCSKFTDLKQKFTPELLEEKLYSSLKQILDIISNEEKD